MLKTLIFSDTHQQHLHLKLPEDIETYDLIIHAGDGANPQNPGMNKNKMQSFLEWYDKLPIKNKIYVPGNHCTSIESGLINYSDFPGINFLGHKELIIEGIKFFGSYYTPRFGVGWAFNVDRDKIYHYWEQIPEDTFCLITHGPPHGILDKTRNESVGCEALRKRVAELKNLRYHIFGHIHSEHGHKNFGQEVHAGVTFINASLCNLYHEPVNDFVTINI